MKIKFLVYLVVFQLSGIALINAQSNLKSTEVNVFKNGTYFIVKEGTVPLKDGQAVVELPAAPLLSTFWFTTSKDISITKMIFMSDTIRKMKKVISLAELIPLNIGKDVVLTVKTGENTEKELTGKLGGFIATASMVKIISDNRTLYLYLTDIRRMSFLQNPKEDIQRDSVAMLGRVVFNKQPDNTKLKLVYMQAGIPWIPSYNIKLIDDKELQLEMRALVENFAEKIDEANLTLTVGDPTFKYGRNPEHFISGYLTNLYGNQNANVNRYAYQNVLYTPSPAAAYDEADGNQPDYNDYTVYTTEGEKTNDLYMYNLGKVSIPKNSKTSFQIFSQKIPYKDVYTVSITDIVNYSGTSYINIDPEKRYDVYHSLKLSNTTKTPFTTAPVFVQNEKLQPLAQDELKYTPIGSDVSVQLSKAVDVIVKNNEEETKKIEKDKTVGKYVYNKIIIRGTIEISNLQGKKIMLNVKKGVNATVVEVSNNGKIKKPGKYTGLNPYNEVQWELELNENDKKTITYIYEVFVLYR